ncbi:MAG: hypothetical protein Q9157_004683 [Trypethelium eluteriae]
MGQWPIVKLDFGLGVLNNFGEAGHPVTPGIKAVGPAAGCDHSIAITTTGKAYSWGFNATFQIGQDGNDGELNDIMLATLIDNTALREANVNWAGAGGQFSVITATAPFKAND